MLRWLGQQHQGLSLPVLQELLEHWDLCLLELVVFLVLLLVHRSLGRLEVGSHQVQVVWLTAAPSQVSFEPCEELILAS